MSSPVSCLSAAVDSELDIEHDNNSLRASSSIASSPPRNALSECTSSNYASSENGESQPEAESENTRNEELGGLLKHRGSAPQDEEETERRISRLQTLLKQSTAYSTVLKQRMDEEKEKQAALVAERQKEGKAVNKRGPPGAHASPKGKRRRRADGEAFVTEEAEAVDEPVFQQPSLITGAKLKPYQLEGLQWMVSLDQNGMSGILADEMGLGKTLQTIAFSAYLRERGNFKPFLIVCPLSVLHNWQAEYKKFASEIPVCIYHGTKEERAELRRNVIVIPNSKLVHRQPPKKKSTAKPKGKTPKRRSGRLPKPKPQENERRRSGRPRKYHPVVIDSDSDECNAAYKPMEVDREKSVKDMNGTGADDDYTATFPIVLTTYEIIIRDRTHLQCYDWGYIVVDEGHRLKNLDCKLMREIKKYSSAGRMILTGTPLHNNLAELWSLLNFILPDIFGDLDSFQEWFNLPDLHNTLPTDQCQQIISSLHAILKPFLLRRMKVDVETNLPPKKEYVLYCPLSVRQREAYDKVIDGGLRNWLIRGGTSGEIAIKEEDENKDEDQSEKGGQVEQDGDTNYTRSSRRLATMGQKSYAVDGDDDEYFEMMDRGEVDERGVIALKSKEEEANEQAKMAKEHQFRTKVRQVNNMKLQNAVMQLRKVCSHPFLFDWPIDPETHDLVLGEELVNASGKMMVLDRLLRELFRRGHKVLIFSQFKIMLNIIQDWAEDYMGWPLCRIDGETKPFERMEQMARFQDAPDAPSLFLLSTRAGGLGINLTAADTVIFYDQDWNPQMDAQAQDRAHRIGQTKPVLIFRLVSAHTIETKILQRASEKRKLEALVIAKGKFKMPSVAMGTGTGTTKKETMAEMAASLLKLEGEKIEVVPETKEGKRGVLSDEDLEMLLDRRPEVFRERGEGWISSRAQSGAVPGTKTDARENNGRLDHAALESGKKAAFAVYQAPIDKGNEALAKMLSEDV